MHSRPLGSSTASWAPNNFHPCSQLQRPPSTAPWLKTPGNSVAQPADIDRDTGPVLVLCSIWGNSLDFCALLPLPGRNRGQQTPTQCGATSPAMLVQSTRHAQVPAPRLCHCLQLGGVSMVLLSTCFPSPPTAGRNNLNNLAFFPPV